MKKLAIFLAIMLIPFSAFALDTISDSDLDSVTGQAGVSIFTNSIQIVKTGVTTTYTDLNGTGNATLTGNGQSGSFSIVADRTVTQIFFKGYDPINIDVVDIADAVAIINAAAELGAGQTPETGNVFYGGTSDAVTANYDIDGLGLSGVQITLPNMIEIQNLGSTKTYYACDADNIATEDSMIQITTTGGKTEISLALETAEVLRATATAASLPVSTVYDAYLAECNAYAWSNAADGAMGLAGIDHADQIKILITSHE